MPIWRTTACPPLFTSNVIFILIKHTLPHDHFDHHDHPHWGVNGGGHGRGRHAPAHVWCWTSAACSWPLLTENRLARGFSIISDRLWFNIYVNLSKEAWRSNDHEYKNNKPNYVDSAGGCDEEIQMLWSPCSLKFHRWSSEEVPESPRYPQGSQHGSTEELAPWDIFH